MELLDIFVLKKLISPLVHPVPGLLLIALLALLVGRYSVFKRVAQTIVGTSLLILLALSSPQVSNTLLSTLEPRYPPVLDSPADTEAIFVLSAYAQPRNAPPNSALSATMLSRMTEGIRLWQQSQDKKLILFGRSGPLAREYALVSGVDDKSIMILDNARDTVSEIKLISAWAKSDSENPVVVSSATHLARVDILLRCAGLQTYTLAPTDYLNSKLANWYNFSGSYLYKSGRVIHEYVGMIIAGIRCRKRPHESGNH